MSADNGVYILETEDGFRVAHCQAIDDLDDDNYWVQAALDKFDGCVVYETKEEACKAAAKLHTELGWTEYGICMLDFSDRVFPDADYDAPTPGEF